MSTCQHGQVPSACVECYREAEAPPSEINDKTGWVYDPGQALANLRRAEAAEKRVAELEAEALRYPLVIKALKLAYEWSAKFPLQGWDASNMDAMASQEVYAACDAALAELREVSEHPEPAPGDWDIIAEIAKLVERQREMGCAEESCGCPGSQLAGLLDKLRAEFQGECAKEKPWPEGALVNANRIVEPEHPTPAPQESRLRSSAYESSSECPICELPCKHCGRTKINHFGRAWHCKRYVIDDESDPIFEVEDEHPGGPPAKEKHP